MEGGVSGRGADHPDRWSAAVRDLVEAHRPADERERSSRSEMLSALDALVRPWDEAADPVHVTASALIVGRRGIVLHKHRRLGRWMQPGGHLEPGEWPHQAARREATEETGLETADPPGGPRMVHLDVHGAAKGHTHLDLRYLLIGTDEDPVPSPGESPDVRWCTLEEATSLADAALEGALAAVARYVGPGAEAAAARDEGQ
jgi:8-oxo-dGTP pyrophosphatase MutT (NUDIX family)